MRVDVSVCGRKRVAVSLSDATSVCGAVSVVMWSSLTWDCGSMSCVLMFVSVLASVSVTVSVSGATRVRCAVRVVMWSTLDGGSPVGVMRVDVMSVSLAASASPSA
jgi:hypothetical protein